MVFQVKLFCFNFRKDVKTSAYLMYDKRYTWLTTRSVTPVLSCPRLKKMKFKVLFYFVKNCRKNLCKSTKRSKKVFVHTVKMYSFCHFSFDLSLASSIFLSALINFWLKRIIFNDLELSRSTFQNIIKPQPLLL
jgi:hypothetical protein